MNTRNSEAYYYEYARNEKIRHIYGIRVQSKTKFELDRQKMIIKKIKPAFHMHTQECYLFFNMNLS